MSNVSLFNFETHKIRMQLDDKNQPWFCLVDLCQVLGIGNTSTVRNRLDESYLCKREVATPYGKKDALFVAEPNVYQVIICSNREEAKRFKKWLYEEVLPQIRKTGSYGQQQLTLDKPVEYSRWVTGWEIEGLHDLIHETAEEYLPYYGKEAEEAIIMRIKYELNLGVFERETTIRQDTFDKAYDIACKIYNEAQKFADQAQRHERGFIKDKIKGIALKL